MIQFSSVSSCVDCSVVLASIEIKLKAVSINFKIEIKIKLLPLINKIPSLWKQLATVFPMSVPARTDLARPIRVILASY